MKLLIEKRVALFNRNDYAIFISTIFENVYMVKLVHVPGSGSVSESVQVRGRDIFSGIRA